MCTPKIALPYKLKYAIAWELLVLERWNFCKQVLSVCSTNIPRLKKIQEHELTCPQIKHGLILPDLNSLRFEPQTSTLQRQTQ